MPKLFVIEGLPTAWKRAGYNRATACIYDRQRDERIYSKLLIEKQRGTDPLLKGPLALYVTFYMYINKSLSRERQRQLEGTYHAARPDADNLLKMVEDICSGVLFYDDAQVAVTSCKKVYSSYPRTVFTFVELNGKESNLSK
jgi:Holliday junction resolvase RusA-like endonuclease